MAEVRELEAFIGALVVELTKDPIDCVEVRRIGVGQQEVLQVGARIRKDDRIICISHEESVEAIGLMVEPHGFALSEARRMRTLVMAELRKLGIAP